MKVLSAGWGSPPPDVNFDIAVNTSRILSRLGCGEKHAYAYEDNRVLAYEKSPALQLGSIWHVALERLAYGDTARMVIEDHMGEPWVEDRHGKTQEDLFGHLLRAYETHYDGAIPGGTILGTEVPFWLLVDTGVVDNKLSDKSGLNVIYDYKVLVRGRLDRVCNWHGMAVNGEIKTMAAGTKVDDFMGLRAGHPQDALYYLALCHAPPELPNGAVIPEQVYGTRYDTAQKYSYPKRAHKGVSLEQRIAEYPRQCFYAHGISWTAERAERVAGKAISDYLGLAGTRHRNYSACNVFGKCAYFDVCHRGLSLSSGIFKDREGDYVDEAGV